jgi:hypothetical protein
MHQLEKSDENLEIAEAHLQKAGESIQEASKARRYFYQRYMQKYPNDGYLIRHFADEYYLSCTERHSYIKDAREKKENERAVRAYFLKHGTDKGRLHAVKQQLHDAYSKIFIKS